MVDYNVTDRDTGSSYNQINQVYYYAELCGFQRCSQFLILQTYINVNNHIITQSLVSIPCLPISAGVLEKSAFVQETILIAGWRLTT